MVQSKFMLELTPVSGFLTHYGIEWGFMLLTDTSGSLYSYSLPLVISNKFNIINVSCASQYALACYVTNSNKSSFYIASKYAYNVYWDVTGS